MFEDVWRLVRGGVQVSRDSLELLEEWSGSGTFILRLRAAAEDVAPVDPP